MELDVEDYEASPSPSSTPQWYSRPRAALLLSDVINPHTALYLLQVPGRGHPPHVYISSQRPQLSSLLPSSASVPSLGFFSFVEIILSLNRSP